MMNEDIEITVSNDDALRLFYIDEKVRVLMKLSSKCHFCNHYIRLGKAYCNTCLKEWLNKPYVI